LRRFRARCAPLLDAHASRQACALAALVLYVDRLKTEATHAE
jgi:hypothetical protein